MIDKCCKFCSLFELKNWIIWYFAGIQGSPRKLDGSKVVSSPGGEGVLANFFNSLLYKKTGSPGGVVGTKVTGSEVLPDKATMRSDAAAELDRLARSGNKKPPGTSGNGGTPTGVDFNVSDC